jgi:hypothetical protein
LFEFYLESKGHNQQVDDQLSAVASDFDFKAARELAEVASFVFTDEAIHVPFQLVKSTSEQGKFVFVHHKDFGNGDKNVIEGESALEIRWDYDGLGG